MVVHRLAGACHCGNVRVAVGLSQPPDTYSPRACDCDFCSKHGAAYLSDPEGSLRVEVRDARSLGRYRQGSAIADCLICRNCGVLLGIAYTHEGRSYATINSRIFAAETNFAAAVAVSPKTLPASAKAERWRSLWFRDVDIVGGEVRG